jgi:hypothetical protein
MTSSERRRPLPALVFLAALTLLSGLVWYRVLHRDGSSAHASSSPPCPISTAPTVPRMLPRPGKVDVLVLNSTQRNGLAAGTAKALARAGFTITGEKNDEPSYGGHGAITGVGEIRFGPSQRAAATLLSYYLPGAKLVPADSPAASVVVSLGRKFTKVADKHSVRKALQARTAEAQTSPSAAPSSSTSASCAG